MLEGQRVVVVGGSSGMGLATAKLLASRGAHVFIAGRSRDKLDAALAQIKGSAEAKPLDFVEEEGVRTFFKSVGTFDHLVLMGAGMPAWGNFLEIDSAALESAFRTKFWGYFFCTKYAVPFLRGDGSMVFTAGGAARSAIPGMAGVAAVNGAIISMAFSLAKELAPLRVNIISPGPVKTPAYDYMPEEEREAFFRQVGANLPVGRIGKTEELADAVLFLVTNEYATGTILDVDGGARLH